MPTRESGSYLRIASIKPFEKSTVLSHPAVVGRLVTGSGTASLTELEVLIRIAKSTILVAAPLGHAHSFVEEVVVLVEVRVLVVVEVEVAEVVVVEQHSGLHWFGHCCIISGILQKSAPEIGFGPKPGMVSQISASQHNGQVVAPAVPELVDVEVLVLVLVVVDVVVANVGVAELHIAWQATSWTNAGCSIMSKSDLTKWSALSPTSRRILGVRMKAARLSGSFPLTCTAITVPPSALMYDASSTASSRCGTVSGNPSVTRMVTHGTPAASLGGTTPNK